MHAKTMLILHVEDDDDHAELVAAAAMENRLPCDLVRFSNAEDALEYLRTESGSSIESRQPDLILLDLALPGMSGMEFLRAIRQKDHTASIPVIVLSTSGRESDVAKAYEIGANSYILKPTSIDEFVIKLAEMNMYWGVTAELPAASDGW